MPCKIMIVDDDDMQVELFEHMLSNDDWKIFGMTCGRSIVDLCEEVKPDLILLDIVMPKKSGINVYQELKLNPTTKHIEVLFITGCDNIDEYVKILNVSADTFLRKPVARSTLKSRVSEKVILQLLNDLKASTS